MAELGRESIRRNPLIADLLHRIEFIEKAGTGIRRIRDEAREQGCPEPEFKIRGAFFVVVFRPDPEVRALEDQVTGEVTPKSVTKPPGKLPRKIPRKIPRKLPTQDTTQVHHASYHARYWGSYRGSASVGGNIRRNEQTTDPRSLRPKEYRTRPQNLPVPRPASRPDRNDHPRQAA